MAHGETTTTTGIAPESAAPERKHIMSRIKIGIAGLLTALTIGTALVGAPSVASAASGVSYCFQYTNGLAAVTAKAPSRYDATEYTTLLGYVNGAWTPLAYGETNNNGCSSFSISGSWRNLYVKVHFFQRVSSHIWLGQSPLMALPGSAAPFLGTGIVRQVS
jgi:hypothetical protein